MDYVAALAVLRTHEDEVVEVQLYCEIGDWETSLLRICGRLYAMSPPVGTIASHRLEPQEPDSGLFTVGETHLYLPERRIREIVPAVGRDPGIRFQVAEGTVIEVAWGIPRPTDSQTRG